MPFSNCNLLSSDLLGLLFTNLGFLFRNEHKSVFPVEKKTNLVERKSTISDAQNDIEESELTRHRMLRASARGLLVGRRRDLMASLLAFSSSAAGLPPKSLPPSTSPPPPSASASTSARASRFRLLLARAAARRDPEPPPSPPPPAAEEKKSLAVRTGELFLGMTAMFVRAGRGTAPVEEVEEREGVVWEQRPEDMEAERQQREVAMESPERKDRKSVV